MKSLPLAKLLFVFTIVFSLSSLPGPLSSIMYHPPLVHANPAPVRTWTPAGAASNIFLGSVFSSEFNEYSSLINQGIDLMDWPLASTQINCLNFGDAASCGGGFTINTANYFLTSQMETGFSAVEFNLANNFWGCDFHFGNNSTQTNGLASNCGQQIRQGIAHLIDKSSFTASEGFISGHANPLDNPVLLSEGLVTPNPCSWDTLFPEAGSNCVVGNANGINTGGTAYHLASACLVSPCPGPSPWSPGPGSPDLCAAAQHFINAGLASGKNTNCVLTGINPIVTKNTVGLFYRTDSPPLFDLGISVAQEICYLFTGLFSNGCSLNQGSVLTTTGDTVGSFCGLPSLANTNSINKCWWIYTAGQGASPAINPFEDILDRINSLPDAFDGWLYAYNSLFVSGGTWDNPPCLGSTSSYSPTNYRYLCNPSYDSISSQMEFAPCLTAPGDPTAGQTTPTFASCPNTNSLTAVSAGYQTEDAFGKAAFTIPIWSGRDQFGYLSNVQPSGIPNYFTWLNARIDPSSLRPGQISGVLRQGFIQSSTSLSPYAANTGWDFMLLGDIYDSIYASNPLNSNQFFNWMTTSSQIICSPTSVTCTSALLGYTPPSGTKAVIRSFLRNDMFWHDSVGSNQPVTAWDVRFSDLTLKATGAF